jgi:hypothetical protein
MDDGLDDSGRILDRRGGDRDRRRLDRYRSYGLAGEVSGGQVREEPRETKRSNRAGEGRQTADEDSAVPGRLLRLPLHLSPQLSGGVGLGLE